MVSVETTKTKRCGRPPAARQRGTLPSATRTVAAEKSNRRWTAESRQSGCWRRADWMNNEHTVHSRVNGTHKNPPFSPVPPNNGNQHLQHLHIRPVRVTNNPKPLAYGQVCQPVGVHLPRLPVGGPVQIHQRRPLSRRDVAAHSTHSQCRTQKSQNHAAQTHVVEGGKKTKIRWQGRRQTLFAYHSNNALPPSL